MRHFVLSAAIATLVVTALAVPEAAAAPVSPAPIADSGSLGDGSSPLGTLPLIALFFPYAGSAIALGCPLGSGSGTGHSTEDPTRPAHCKALDNLYFGSF